MQHSLKWKQTEYVPFFRDGIHNIPVISQGDEEYKY